MPTPDESTPVPSHACSGCGAKLDAAADPYGDQTPEEGDLTICIYCGEVSMFTETLHLKKATDADIGPGNRAEIRRLQQIIYQAMRDRPTEGNA